jgi:tetratricopeptide (TPR) repeat protein
MKAFSFLVFLASLLLAFGCATTGSREGQVRNSILSNMNSAPASMSPPNYSEKENPSVDPTYVRSQADYHFSRAEAFSLDGKGSEAIEEFKLTLVYDSKSPTVFLRLGAEYLRQGSVNEAVEQATAGLDVDPSHEELRVFLGGLYATLKMYPQAREQYEYLIKANPNNGEALIYLGDVESSAENYDKAEAYFYKAAKMPNFSKSHVAYYYLAKTHVSAGESGYPKAIQALNSSLTSRPDFEEAALSLADIYFAQQKKQKALDVLEAYQAHYGPRKNVAYQLSQVYLEAENFPKAYQHLKVLESFEPSNLNVKVKIALILIEQKNYYEAVDKLEEIISLAPSSDKIRYYLAAVYEEVKNIKLAIFNYKSIDASSTYFPDAVVRAANLLRQQGDIKAAGALMADAINKRKDSPAIFAYYATILDEEKEYKKGIEILEAGVKRYPENTQLNFYLGSMYERVGRQDESVAQMRKVLGADSNHVQALNFLAYTLAEQGNLLDEAEALALKAVDLEPKDPYVMDTVGWVYFKKGRVEEAIRYLEAAFQSKSSESIIAEHLGDAYYVYELMEKAREMYLRAVALEPDEKKANRIRAKLTTIDRSGKKDRLPASR